MESVLYVRKRRTKLLHTWQKRYVVLSIDGILKEYAEASSGKQSSAAIAGSGMALKLELHIHGASVVTLPFPLVGRPHAFRISRNQNLRVTLAAKSADQMHKWLAVMRTVCRVAHDESTSIRTRSPAMWGHGQPGAASRSFFGDANRGTALHASNMELPVVALPRTSEQEFIDIEVKKLEELVHLLQISEWNSHRLRTRSDWGLSRIPLVRGSMVVAINGISMQTLNEDEVAAMLRRPKSLPVTLRWLKSPHRRGILKCKLCYGLTTQLKTIAMYRNGLRAWKEQIVEIDGDVLTCQPKADGGKESNRSVIPLAGGCTVKTVHEIVAEQKYCFLVSVKAYSTLFQASSREELIQWTDAIQRAINIAEGCIPGFDLTLDDLQLESSVNMRSRGTLLADSLWPSTSSAAVTQDLGIDDSDSDASQEEADADAESGEETGDQLQLPRRGSEFPDDQLSGMLEFLQSTGRFIEALQLMSSESAQRAAYWKSIFRWAIDPVELTDFQDMLEEELNPADSIQVLKDVPRTSKWLAGSPGAPVLAEDTTRARLKSLQSVLHTFLISCNSDIRTDARSRNSIEIADGKSFYMQGMNGLAFIILEVVRDDEVAGLELLRGVVTHILPHVFGIRTVQSGGDNFDLFSSLIEVGNVLEEVVQMHLPNFHDAMEQAGLPVCLLAYKWFPTLFSDISLMAHRSQLRYDTLLAIWDVCLLMGIEGMFCVALALFSAAEEEVVSLRAKGASTETITATIITVLADIGPHDLIISVCEVIELCSHPVLLKLRNGHRRRLQQHNETVKNSPQAKPVDCQTKAKCKAKVTTPSASQESTTAAGVAGASQAAAPMTVRDLDSGKLFRISNTGSMLLPVKPSSSRG